VSPSEEKAISPNEYWTGEKKEVCLISGTHKEAQCWVKEQERERNSGIEETKVALTLLRGKRGTASVEKEDNELLKVKVGDRDREDAGRFFREGRVGGDRTLNGSAN